jgi:hypothetical protein
MFAMTVFWAPWTMPNTLTSGESRTCLQILLALLFPRAVGIATGYGLGGPGIDSRWGERFSAPVQTGSEVHPASYTMGTRSFSGVKRPGFDLDHPPQSRAEVKEIVELYLYSPSGSWWFVLGWSSPLPLPFPLCSYTCKFCLFSYLWLLLSLKTVITNNYIQRLYAYGVRTQNVRLVSVREHVTASPLSEYLFSKRLIRLEPKIVIFDYRVFHQLISCTYKVLFVRKPKNILQWQTVGSAL